MAGYINNVAIIGAGLGVSGTAVTSVWPVTAHEYRLTMNTAGLRTWSRTLGEESPRHHLRKPAPGIRPHPVGRTPDSERPACPRSPGRIRAYKRSLLRPDSSHLQK